MLKLCARLTAALLLTAIGCLCASAQQTTPNTMPGCVYNLTPPSLSNGQIIPWQCDVNGKLITSGGGVGTSIVVGTTTITSGTNTRVLYDNAGILGEYTISGTGSVAMTTSPTFVTPTLGVAAGTSLALGGCTIGSLALCGGASSLSGTGSPPILTLTKTTSDTVAKSTLDLHTSTSNAGRFIQLFLDDSSTTNPVTYFNDGAHFFTKTSVTISGSSSGANITPPGDAPYMMGLWGDVNGAMIVSRLTSYSGSSLNARHIDFLSNNNGVSGPAFELSILQQGQLGWGTSTSFGNADTFLNRGNAAASLQQGLDAFAPVAQRFTTNNVTAPISVTATAATAAGSAVLNFNTVLPPNVVVGMGIVDATTGGAISGGTTVLSIAAGRDTLTMSANAAGGGVGNGDTITFNSTNIAGVDRYIDGSQGTGTGVGGKIHLTAAPAGSTGAAQNALVDVIVIDPAAPSATVAPVTIGRGALSVRQLTFTPNSGTDSAFGTANGGSGLLHFSGSLKVWVEDDNGIGFNKNGLIYWTTSTTDPSTTKQATMSSTSSGLVNVGTSGNNALGSMAMAGITVSGAAVKFTGVTTGTNADTLCLAADGTVLIQAAACTISSLRFKPDWALYRGDALTSIGKLDVGTFHIDLGGRPNVDVNAGNLQAGLSAESVAEAMPLCAIYEQDNVTPKSYRQECVIAFMVKAFTELKADNDNLRENIRRSSR